MILTIFEVWIDIVVEVCSPCSFF